MTILGADLRRQDERTNVRLNPFWVTSALFGAKQAGKVAGLMSFPSTIGTCFIHEMIVGVKTPFAGGTPAINIGYCTLTDESVDLTYLNYDADWFIADGEINKDAVGYSAGGLITLTANPGTSLIESGTLWGMSKLHETDGTNTAGGDMTKRIITGADLVKPCITAELSADLTAGEARLYIMMSRVL